LLGIVYVLMKSLSIFKTLTMKRITYFMISILMLSGIGKAVADEGMWLPMFIDRLNYVDMQKLGLQLTAEEIYSVNNASLKDAILGLSNEPNPSGFFCTAELVSSQGLMFTNHHCGFDAIQNHSSVEHDYLADGFWAMSKDEELPNEGMTASVLVYMSDVTDSILPFISDTLTGSARNAAIREITSKLKKNASEDGKYNPVIKSFFEGNEYYMFVYLVYKDIRLVGAPPSSIGKFGGDTDNWMWPRHTGDFSIFRVYTAPDGSPAEYAEENIPLVPKHYLPVSIDGVEEGDFTMIWGFPGGTERYTTSEGVQFKLDYYYPPLIEALGAKLEVWKEHMDASQEVRIKYASQYASTANGWKYFIGQAKGVVDLDVVGDKAAFEAEFTDWVNANPQRKQEYGNVLPEMNVIYDERAEGIGPLIYASLCGVGGAGIIDFAGEFSGLQGLMTQLSEEKDKEKKAKKEEQIKKAAEGMRELVAEHFKDYDKATDEEVFAVMTQMYFEELPEDLHPEVLDKMVAKNKGDFYAYANYVFEKSFLADQVSTEAFLNEPSLKVLDKDPAFQLMQGYMQIIMTLSGEYRKDSDQLAEAERLYVKAVREMQPDAVFYPDANSTLRFSYGTVMDYDPADAIKYDYKTHLSGVMEKEDPENDEFIVEEKLKELYLTKDYGPYADEDGRMVVCFLTNNDITGGNSGSPVVNAKGELIGLAFDGNWEAMSSDIAFAPEMQRTIVVDARYVLFIIDKFAGATNLIDELTIVQSMPEPERIEVIEVIEVEEASVN
jgi:hypothetical protein